MRALVLIFAVFCLSTSVVFIKDSTMPPGMMAAGRLLLAAAILSPVFLRDLRRCRREGVRNDFRAVIIPALWFALHFVTWIRGARMIPAAHSSLIINLVPVAMPFLLVIWLKERLSRAEIIGTVCALAGGAVLAVSDYRFSPEHLPGDALCFGSMLCLTVYLVLARRNRTFHSVWLYTVPLYAISGLFCLLLSAPLEVSQWRWPVFAEFRLLMGLTLVCTVVGHTLLANAMRQFPGQTVALFNLGQFVFAGAMAVPIFLEKPRFSFYLAGALIVAGAMASILWKHKDTAPVAPETAEREAETADAPVARPLP